MKRKLDGQPTREVKRPTPTCTPQHETFILPRRTSFFSHPLSCHPVFFLHPPIFVTTVRRWDCCSSFIPFRSLPCRCLLALLRTPLSHPGPCSLQLRSKLTPIRHLKARCSRRVTAACIPAEKERRPRQFKKKRDKKYRPLIRSDRDMQEKG